MPRQITTLTLEDARRGVAAGERKALELKIPYNLAVVDSAGVLITHTRMDGAWPGSVDIAIDKAWAARAFEMTTEALSHFGQAGQHGFGINTTNQGRVVIFGGGMPIRIGGNVIGAVGASGGTVEQDIAVAAAAASGLEL